MVFVCERHGMVYAYVMALRQTLVNPSVSSPVSPSIRLCMHALTLYHTNLYNF